MDSHKNEIEAFHHICNYIETSDNFRTSIQVLSLANEIGDFNRLRMTEKCGLVQVYQNKIDDSKVILVSSKLGAAVYVKADVLNFFRNLGKREVTLNPTSDSIESFLVNPEPSKTNPAPKVSSSPTVALKQSDDTNASESNNYDFANSEILEIPLVSSEEDPTHENIQLIEKDPNFRSIKDDLKLNDAQLIQLAKTNYQNKYSISIMEETHSIFKVYTVRCVNGNSVDRYYIKMNKINSNKYEITKLKDKDLQLVSTSIKQFLSKLKENSLNMTVTSSPSTAFHRKPNRSKTETKGTNSPSSENTDDIDPKTRKFKD